MSGPTTPGYPGALGLPAKTEMVWRAVRCCCEPGKILGFMAVPDVMATKLVMKDRDGRDQTIELRRFMDSGRVVSAELLADLRTIPPELAARGPVTETAIYSDDRPVEFWRTMPRFVEAAS